MLMEKTFRYESDLVKTFEEKYFHKKQTLLIKEMNIRWGNIDLVEINSVSLPFTPEQCKVLSKPSNAKIFVRLNNKRPLSKQKLFVGLGISESTFQNALSELLRADLIVREKQNYWRNVNFVFPKVVITGYEAKLTDFQKAIFQAKMNKAYVDYSYMVFPIEVAEKLLEKYGEVIESMDLGLIGVSKNRTRKYIKAKKSETMKPYIRLMNLVISSDMHREEAAV